MSCQRGFRLASSRRGNMAFRLFRREIAFRQRRIPVRADTVERAHRGSIPIDQSSFAIDPGMTG